MGKARQLRRAAEHAALHEHWEASGHRRFNVQCINHGLVLTGIGIEDLKLYARCVAREQAGYLDALCLGPDNTECPHCAEERRRQEQRDERRDLTLSSYLRALAKQGF